MTSRTTRQELLRQTTHFIIGLVLLALFLTTSKTHLFFLLATLTLFILATIHHYHHRHKLISKIRTIISLYERKTVLFKGLGVFTFLLGFALTTAIFPKQAAINGLIILIVGDAAATIFGHQGDHTLPWNNHKTWEGLLGSCFTAGMILTLLHGPKGFLLALVGSIIEGLPLPNYLDDNILLPLSVALISTILL